MTTDTLIKADTATAPANALVRRPASARGHANHGWLKSAHSFSFASYYDPENLHFEALRVINDDEVAPGGGFPMHPHQDFEIFSYVLKGQIAHKDSMGNGSVVGAGGVQYMTAGSGVRHSEFNPSDEEGLEFLQIWLMPTIRGAQPRYETRELTAAEKAGKFALFISEDGRDGSIRTLAPANVYAATFDEGQSTTVEVRKGRRGYVHVARGSVSVNGERLERGDALKVMEPGTLTFTDGEAAEVLFFDLARVG